MCAIRNVSIDASEHGLETAWQSDGGGAYQLVDRTAPQFELDGS